MEQLLPQSQAKTDAEHIAAIEEMERELKRGFERIDEAQRRTRESQLRAERMLEQLEARR